MNVNAQRWIVASLIGLSISGFCGLELFARRDWTVNLYLVNKVVASTAVLMIAGSFLLSALRRLFGWLSRQQAYARPIGVVGGLLALGHVGITLFVSDPSGSGARKFLFPEYYLSHLLSILFALVGLIVLLNMLRISFPSNAVAIKKYTAKRWKRMLRHGYLAVPCIALHAALLKFPGWIRWLDSFDPILPPLSLIVSAILLAMMTIKAIHVVVRSHARRTRAMLPGRTTDSRARARA